VNFLQRDDARAGSEATLPQLLKLRVGEVATLVVRPDGYVAVAHRGLTWDVQSVIKAVVSCGAL